MGKEKDPTPVPVRGQGWTVDLGGIENILSSVSSRLVYPPKLKQRCLNLLPELCILCTTQCVAS